MLLPFFLTSLVLSSAVSAASSKGSSSTAPAIVKTSSQKTSLTKATSTLGKSVTTAKSTSSTPTCPPYTVSTTTLTTTTTLTSTKTPKPVPTSTTTTYIYPSAPTITSYYSYNGSTYDAIVTTTFVPFTYTVFKVTVPPASTTVYKATNPGFTPLLCEPEYFRKTATKVITEKETTTYSITVTATSTLVAGTYTTYIATASSITNNGMTYTSTIVSYATVTTTTTRVDPTKTIYAACTSNNIAQTYPGGLFFYTAYTDGGFNEGRYEELFATDAVDCCGLCQGNSSCVGSLYQEIFNRPAACSVFYKDSIASPTCNPAYKGITGSARNTPGPTAANGPCGQYAFM